MIENLFVGLGLALIIIGALAIASAVINLSFSIC